MRISIRAIHIFTKDGDENIIHFSDSITFIYGNVGAGKTTLLNLIMYGLGCDLIYTPAVKRCLGAVQVDVMLGDKPFSFFRMANSNRIQIEDEFNNKRYGLIKNQISSFIYQQFSLPDIYFLRRNIEKNVKLSFTNFCWFSYLKQTEMDNNFFNLNSDNIYKQNASINVLLSFFESEFLINQKKNNRYQELKKQLRQYEEGYEVFKYLEKIFYSYENPSNSELSEVANQLKRQIDHVLTNQSYYSEVEVCDILEMQRLLIKIEYRMAFEQRRERYCNKRGLLQDEMKQILKKNNIVSIDNSNVQKLYKLFLDCLINIGFQGVTKYDNINMDSKTYMPILNNHYENRKASFDDLGSGGKKTLYKICFALAIHRLQHLKLEFNYLPSFMIIDTPMKNISEREDVDMYDKFYEYLFTLFSTELSDTQLLIVDKEERDLSSYKFKDKVTIMHMTHDIGLNTPLFKNYKGL